ncbi:MAG TPA: hypothetical protein VFV37_08715 [Luteibaculaceae bacterium]|nr:hypothetical protein [Luteibaculaceae bacterium]
MKKNIKLSDLKIKSFITHPDKIKGGDPRDTLYSCLDYVSCRIEQCGPSRILENCNTATIFEP